jgi:hypothetical protein
MLHFFLSICSATLAYGTNSGAYREVQGNRHCAQPEPQAMIVCSVGSARVISSQTTAHPASLHYHFDEQYLAVV